MAKGRTAGWSERGEKGGRPKKEESEKAKTISFSISADNYAIIKARAEAQGLTIGKYVVKKLLPR